MKEKNNMDRYISLYVILDKLTRNPLMQSLDIEHAIDYAFDFFDLVGLPDQFETKSTNIQIKDYKAELPCDFLREKMVFYVHPKNQKLHPMHYNLDTYRENYDSAKKPLDGKHQSEVQFHIKGDYIYVSNRDCVINIVYESMQLDKEGMPLIPNDGVFIRALEAYIKKEWYQILFDIGKLNVAVMNRADQEYCWAVGALQTDRNKLTLAKAEAFFNSYSRLVTRSNEFKHRWHTAGNKEVWRRN